MAYVARSVKLIDLVPMGVSRFFYGVALLWLFQIFDVAAAARVRRSRLVRHGTRDSPKDGEKEKKPASVKEKIWDLGKEMCKSRAMDPLCDRFRDDEEESTTTEKEESSTTTTTTTESTTTTTESTTTTKSTTTTPAAPSSTPAEAVVAEPAEALTPAGEAESTSAPPKDTVSETEVPPAAPQVTESPAVPSLAPESSAAESAAAGLPSQGYSGRMVQHVDGYTYTSDWGKEGLLPKKALAWAREAREKKGDEPEQGKSPGPEVAHPWWEQRFPWSAASRRSGRQPLLDLATAAVFVYMAMLPHD